MIQLSPMHTQQLEQVIKLKVEPEQLPFVGTVEEVLANADDKVHPHLVLAEGQIVGIFLIDTRYSEQYDFAHSEALGFRAFLIDVAQQGKGYGSQVIAQLGDYLKAHYMEHTSVYLTVNCKNRVALRCYAKYGFKDTGKLYFGGAAGPQHIMLLHYG